MPAKPSLGIMGINLHEVFSAQAGLQELFWGVIVVGIITIYWKRFWNWFSTKPDTWKKKIYLWILGFVKNVLGLSIIGFFATVILFQICRLISDRISAPLNQTLIQTANEFLTPHLALDLNNAYLTSSGTNTLICIYLQVSNTGAPSIIKNWTLTAQNPHGNPIPCIFFITMTNPIVIPISDGNTSKFTHDDLIFTKTVEIPIPRGGSKGGVAAFLIPNVKYRLSEVIHELAESLWKARAAGRE